MKSHAEPDTDPTPLEKQFSGHSLCYKLMTWKEERSQNFICWTWTPSDENF